MYQLKTGNRKGIKDIWNANLCVGAAYGKNDIPFCPTTAQHLPQDMITWTEAKAIHKRNKFTNYKSNTFVCFYEDDYKFDGPNGIWNNPEQTLQILKHFDGVISPDFSTCQDFPFPIKMYATYRMRAYGYWLGRSGISVINNVRWGTPETYSYCFEGIPNNSIVCIGTVGGNPRRSSDRNRFVHGFIKMIETLAPHTIITYGSANYPCFEEARLQGITVISFQSKTAREFDRRISNE